ncbi:hypothetical protein IscW_ISCW019944 [Ixodes scapularis]|uniref:C2 domain-containing protein n=1 Tax=Ixodes scapularis TaxID=6945 RepID=B7PV26_IXOSC|nr:hypothetical protein IscW_ISCW019944 [Ixodes scapularis]|eukprot:XP_002407190.1 hypothetical protein IscW_ISCW019944 [Ixodes scapularis]
MAAEAAVTQPPAPNLKPAIKAKPATVALSPVLESAAKLLPRLRSVTGAAAPPSSIVCLKDTIVQFILLEAEDLDTSDTRPSCDPYVVFKIGDESYQSQASDRECQIYQPVMHDTSDPEWYEIFDIFVAKGGPMALLVMVMNNDRLATTEFFGRHYEYGITYEVQQELENNAGKLFFRMVIQEASSIDSKEILELPSRRTLKYARQRLHKKYAAWNVQGDLTDIGVALISVHRASSIAQPYLEAGLEAVCCVEITPKLLWQKGQPGTVDPVWNTVFKM